MFNSPQVKRILQKLKQDKVFRNILDFSSFKFRHFEPNLTYYGYKISRGKRKKTDLPFMRHLFIFERHLTCSVVVIATVQLYSANHDLSSCANSNLTRGVLEVSDEEKTLKWP